MEKNNKGLVALLIILVLLVIGLFTYIVIDKNNIIDNKDNSVEEKNNNTEKEQNDTTIEEEKDNSSEVDVNNNLEQDTSTEVVQNTKSNINYYTDGTYYHLVLYPEIKHSLSNPKISEKKVNSFYLGVDGGYSNDVLYGDYEILNGKLILHFPVDYNENYVNNTVKSFASSVNIVKTESSYDLTLNYTEDKIIFENYELLKK